MKLTQIALALAAISAAPAFAVDISAGGIPVVYISGASALSGTVGSVVASLCNPATPPIKYIDGLPSDGKQAAAYLCKNALATSGFPANTKYIVVKRDADGSLAGVGPVLFPGSTATDPSTSAGGLNFLDVKNCIEPISPSLVGTCTYILPGALTGRFPPDAGLSDVETTIWQARGQVGTTPPPFTAPPSFAAQGFGIAVTEELYKALKTKQFAEGKLPGCAADIPTDFAAGACQPSISRDQYTSIASQTGGYHTDWSPILGAAFTVGPNKAVNLCRRVSTSGTQAASDIYFLSNPCAKANPTFGLLGPATSAIDSNPGLFHVQENSSTGNVKNCLNFHNNGFNNTSTVSYTNPNGFLSNDEAAEGKFAIGVISLENLPAAGTGPIASGPGSAAAAGDKWKFVKLSNVSPNLEVSGKQRQTAIDGDYDFAFEFQALWLNSLDSARTTFMNAFVAQLSDPINVDLRGIYVVPGTFTNALNPNHVGKGTRLGNSCQPFQLFE